MAFMRVGLDLGRLGHQDSKNRQYPLEEGDRRMVGLKPEEHPEQPNQNGGSCESRWNNRRGKFRLHGDETQAPQWRG